MAGQVHGLGEVMANLNAQVGAIHDRTQRGVNKAALIVLRESNKLVPVDTGNLRQSGFFEPVQTGPPAVIVAYGAEYAVHVHEDLEARHPTGQAKFLQDAVQASQSDILDAIEQEARVR